MRIREDHRSIVLLATVTLCCAVVAGTAELVEPSGPPAREDQAVAGKRMVAANPSPVRVVGTPFVPNVNPRER
jgi:hypothetical protein